MRLSAISRVTAVLSSILLFQLSMLASGTLCRMHGDHAAMPAMSASAAAHSAHQSMVPQPANGAGRVSAASDMSSPCDMRGSCDSPWAPGSGSCSSMATCVNAVSATPSSSAASATLSAAHVQVIASAAMPLGPAYAPELPPPRA